MLVASVALGSLHEGIHEEVQLCHGDRKVVRLDWCMDKGMVQGAQIRHGNSGPMLCRCFPVWDIPESSSGKWVLLILSYIYPRMICRCLPVSSGMGVRKPDIGAVLVGACWNPVHLWLILVIWCSTWCAQGSNPDGINANRSRMMNHRLHTSDKTASEVLMIKVVSFLRFRVGPRLLLWGWM